jgi:hypothetical protein
MSGIYSVSSYDLDYIYEIIQSKIDKKIRIDSLEKCNIVLVTNKEFLTRNLEAINKKIDKRTIFVFGTKTYLKEFNIEHIDEEKLTAAKLKKYINKKSILLEYKRVDLVKKLLKSSKVSVIKNLQTLLYKIQNKDTRESYRYKIFSYLNDSENNIAKLEKSLILMSKKKSSTLKELLEIIHSNIFIETHSAVIEHKKGNMKKSKISSFDINYILSFKNKANI